MKIQTVTIIILFCIAIDGTLSHTHPECGESPWLKYKVLATKIGWEWGQLIRFMRTETTMEYNLLLKQVKEYADCIALSNIPL
ncbi:unnamed protein product [Brachionus calyciflorus]|uniref:Uncharacterized protein n=1 Tax=Brachionus calyciflorus TaxID=104777 RepID=A0A814GSJ9_9BILA|nr:unnamed protein product [Brachionus calyciflorus]